MLTAELDATAIAAAVRARELSPVEVVRAHLERLEEANPELNAVVTVCGAEALQTARELERAPAGPLAGVPFTVKDVVETASVRTTAGSRILADNVPAADAPAVARLRAGGAILLGKGNCSELALWPHTANPLFGATRNPVGPVSPGGSSGGDAAAIAAGIAPLALGGDFGGSLRWPAHCTGIAGLRPTVGLVPDAGQVPQPGPATLQARVSVLGPLARTARDLELALAVLAGAPLAHADGLPPLAWCDGDGSFAVRADIVAVVEAAAAALGAVRARLPALERANDVYSRLRALDGLAEVRALVAGREDELGEPLRELLAATRTGTSTELAQLWSEREKLRDELLAFLEERPVLLLPVAAVPAYDPAAPGHDLSPWEVLAPCRAISLLGVPAAAVTFGASADGLPVAVQVVGRPFREDEVLAVARALEAAR